MLKTGSRTPGRSHCLTEKGTVLSPARKATGSPTLSARGKSTPARRETKKATGGGTSLVPKWACSSQASDDQEDRRLTGPGPFLAPKGQLVISPEEPRVTRDMAGAMNKLETAKKKKPSVVDF